MGSLAFATGAAVVDGPADTIADGNLTIQPVDGPNGAYAYLNDDNEIVVDDILASNPNLDPDFEGINPDALGSAGGVFTITHAVDEYARIDRPPEREHHGSRRRALDRGRAEQRHLRSNVTTAVVIKIGTKNPWAPHFVTATS